MEYASIEGCQKEVDDYLAGEQIDRRLDDILMVEDLAAYLRKKYKDITDTEILRAISLLENISSTPLYEGNKSTYKLITEGYDLPRDDNSKIALHIDYIDFDKIDNNKFKIVNQFSVEDVKNRRPDLLVFINGIPVSIFEFKTAIEEDKTIYDAWEQIHIRYYRDIPKLLKYCCMSVISDGANTKLGTIFSKYKYFYAWNKANEKDKASNGISSLFTMIEGVFSKERILQII